MPAAAAATAWAGEGAGEEREAQQGGRSGALGSSVNLREGPKPDLRLGIALAGRLTPARNKAGQRKAQQQTSKGGERDALTTTPTYDAKGNLTTSFDSSTYVYDAQNRLISATTNGVTETFKYDGLNRQVARTLATVTTYSVYDGWSLLAEYTNGSTSASLAWVYGAGGIVKELTQGFYYYHDGSGSTSHLADSSGTLVEAYRYDLQGMPIFSDGQGNPLTASAYGERFLFTGQQWHSELGLYDLRNRYYSPDIGRFLQPDPIGFGGDPANLYRYCGNNPVNWSDPSGLDDEDDKITTKIDGGGDVESSASDAVSAASDAAGNTAGGTGTGYGQSGDVTTGVTIGDITDASGTGFSANAGVPGGGLDSVTGGTVSGGRGGGGDGGNVGDGGSGGGGGGNFVSRRVGKISNVARGVASDAVMFGQFLGGVGPQIRIFSPSSIESADMRSDPRVQSFAAQAYANGGLSPVRTFSPLDAITAGLHPTRQFVGSYSVEIINGQAVVINRTSMFSLLYHFEFLPYGDRFVPYGGRYDRDVFGPGGNIYQAYILGPYP